MATIKVNGLFNVWHNEDTVRGGRKVDGLYKVRRHAIFEVSVQAASNFHSTEANFAKP
jgi:hypothetical protein